MRRLSRCPPRTSRGNILQTVPLLAGPDVVSEHMNYWQELEAGSDPQDRSLRARTPGFMAGRFEELAKLHVELGILRRSYNGPITSDGLGDFQLLCNAAIGASVLLRQERTIGEYLGEAELAGPESIPQICFDWHERDLRWHAEPEYIPSLVEGFTPSDKPEQWYRSGGLYVQVLRTAAPTTEFEAGYEEFFRAEFDRDRYATITPVAATALMVTLERIPIPDVAVTIQIA